ncbi:MAG TPA: ABC transporter ATP-binding protein [Devosia sp.]|nr:ABC transporter ATP-binding protein [Devosia sp.]
MTPALLSGAAMPLAGDEPLLSVRDLHVEFQTGQRIVHVVNGASIDVKAGETTAILGESGSGKSVTFDAVLGILDTPPGRVTRGAAYFHGQDLFALAPAERRAICGRRIGMIFQDPLSSLNPVYTVGWQIAEMLRVHLGASRRDAHQRAIALLEQVGIPGAGDRVNDYPHQFSGGMRQRVVIAMALAGNPEVVIADEPTTALDVTIEAQILKLLRSLQTDHGVGLVLITHSMGVVAEIADSVSVMYAGRVMESGSVREILKRPAHPYTRGLLRSIPRKGGGANRLVPIAGQPPQLTEIPTGCPYRPRCDFARDICAAITPGLLRFEGGRRASACHFPDEVMEAK